MIDFWQIEGALLTNSAFGEELFAKFPTEQPYPYDPARCGLVIDEEDFKEARKVIEKHINEPVSLFALGELLVSITRPGGRAAMRALRQELAKSGRIAQPLNPRFLVALGALVIDDIHSGI